MKNNNPILSYRGITEEVEQTGALTYSLIEGIHSLVSAESSQSGLPVFTNSMQTKSREAIDTLEYCE
jgi:hypothetical protein